MSDFGNEMGNSGLNLMGKLVDAILKLLSKIISEVGNGIKSAYKERFGVDNQLKRQELKERKARGEINGLAGFVAKETLDLAGEPLSPFGSTMTEKQMNDFAARCKREGIIITGTQEKGSKNPKMYSMMCRTRDLAAVKEIIELMQIEQKIEARQGEIADLEGKNVKLREEMKAIKNKGGELSKEDLENLEKKSIEIEANERCIEKLNADIENLRGGVTKKHNQEQGRATAEEVVFGETERGYGFDETLNRFVGGNINKDGQTVFVVDALDPNKYVKCTTHKDVYEGVTYPKTTYKVYRDGKEALSTHDGRFKGRQDGYWAQQREAMKDAGGFSDAVYVFRTEKEMAHWREAYNKQNEAELSPDVGKTGRNYEAINEDLKATLRKNGAEHRDGGIVGEGDRSATMVGGVYKDGRPLDGSALHKVNAEIEQIHAEAKANGGVYTAEQAERLNALNTETANIAECVVIGKQIENYKEIARLESEVASKKVDVLISEPNTPERKAAEKELESAQGKLDHAYEVEKELNRERKAVNSEQARQEAQENHENTREKTNEQERGTESDAPSKAAQEANEQSDPDHVVEEGQQNESWDGSRSMVNSKEKAAQAKAAKAERQDVAKVLESGNRDER